MEPAAHRRPVARDRLWVHVVWEILLAAGVVAAVLRRAARGRRGRCPAPACDDLLVLVAAGILLGSAFALSLRAAVPNLAVGAVAVVAGVLTAWLQAEHGYELRIAALITLGGAVALGLVTGRSSWSASGCRPGRSASAPRSGCTRRCCRCPPAARCCSTASRTCATGPGRWPAARPRCRSSAACSGCCRGPG